MPTEGRVIIGDVTAANRGRVIMGDVTDADRGTSDNRESRQTDVYLPLVRHTADGHVNGISDQFHFPGFSVVFHHSMHAKTNIDHILTSMQEEH